MKLKFLLFITLLPAVTSGQVYQRYILLKDQLIVQLTEGNLHIIPLSDEAIRVQWEKGRLKEDREFVLVNKFPPPNFKFEETSFNLKIITEAITVLFNKKNGSIEYADQAGNIFLREKPGGRKLRADSLLHQACYVAEQTFDSPKDECLFGLGQFQDGQYNLRNISRKLIQVNTQISIPFVYSSRGYGVLWHQYGITYFNPADSIIPLVKKDTFGGVAGDKEVTTTSGSQKVSQKQSLYSGQFNVDKDGEYTFMLDLKNMGNRHLVIIDGKPCIDQSNLWLPPAASKLVHLAKGKHNVQVVCNSANIPLLTWKPAEDETVFRSPNAKSLDYVVFHGESADEVIGEYRKFSGNVPLLPLWAYGFWQCRERYTSGQDLVETMKTFRQKKLPVDVIVQDWQYWGKNGWGIPKFDTTHYPNPQQFIQKLHDLHAHFCISVWENPAKNSDIAKEEYLAKELYIPNSLWLDIYNPKAQQTHWNVINENLFRYGVDAWWMDATEPENDALAGKKTYFGLGDFYRLTYPLFVSKTIYEGQRKTDPQKRVTILTRSAFAGQQRYGTINWSGDIGSDWDAYKRQIVAGLNYSLTGMPYWTTDIGGFFRPGPSQYTDVKYHDLLIRWFQWGAFNSIFRIHGYQTATEPWNFGPEVEASMRTMLNLRYRLLPYIYSEAWQVSGKGSTIIRPLVMDFKDDTTARTLPYEYMFGKSFLIAPVTEPGVSKWSVYLPKSTVWYNFWNGTKHSGSQTVMTDAPKNQIPVFVKAGSIVPLGKFVQYSSEKTMDTLEIRVYTGKNGEFNLYEDAGDGYDYEKGEYTITAFKWNDQKQLLTIAGLKGSYQKHLTNRVFNIVFVDDNHGGGIEMGNPQRIVHYNGKLIVLKR
ncbi:glycosyl hydrolase family 31 [Mucilaginibacter sp. PPCGB 2223]|nr:glycosyl hydrolase family 31 [Mucilaginibacter sp. PPCGB 2223]